MSVEKWKGIPTYYGGSFRLPLNEPDGKWAVVVVSQSLGNTPGDPVSGAQVWGNCGFGECFRDGGVRLRDLV